MHITTQGTRICLGVKKDDIEKFLDIVSILSDITVALLEGKVRGFGPPLYTLLQRQGYLCQLDDFCRQENVPIPSSLLALLNRRDFVDIADMLRVATECSKLQSFFLKVLTQGSRGLANISSQTASPSAPPEPTPPASPTLSPERPDHGASRDSRGRFTPRNDNEKK